MSSLFVRWSEAPGTITSFYRMLGATLFLLPVYIRHQHMRQRGNPPQEKPALADRILIPLALVWMPLLGGLFVAMDHTFWSIALGITRVANATLINNLAPLWVALFAVLIWKEKRPGRFWIGLVLTLLGAGVVFGNTLVENPSFSFGDVLSLFASFFYAAYYLVTQRARQVFNTLPYVFWTCVAATLALFMVNIVWGQPFGGYSTTTWLIFLAAALFSQIGGYFSVSYALGHLPAALVSPTMIAQPVLTALLAIPLVNEPLTAGQVAGGIITLAGIYMVNRT